MIHYIGQQDKIQWRQCQPK